MRQYRLEFITDQGEEPLATLDELVNGAWAVTVLEGPRAALATKVLAIVSLRRLQRLVSPDEGDLYLDAVRETFSNASRYRLVRVPAAP